MTNSEYLMHVHTLGQRATAGSPPLTADYYGFNTRQGVYYELVKMELMQGGHEEIPLRMPVFDMALQWICDRNDCADFLIPALVRMQREHRHTPRLDEALAQRIEDALVGFKYWLDEPGEVHACFFTENHQILFHSAEYLAGQLYPDHIFPSNGQTGAWHQAHATTYLRRWLDWRTRFGFSEWLTQGYYMDDMLALLGLMHYADEEDIRLRCRMLIDMLLFDMAVNSFKGNLSSTHGRVYARYILAPAQEACSPVMGLMWGEGNLDGELSDCAIMLAIYGYECPAAIRAAARGQLPVMTNRERMSMDVSDAKRYGVDPADFDNIMFFWGMQTYSDRLCIENSLKVYPYWNWVLNRVYAYREMYKLADDAGVPAVDAPDYTAMTQVDIYTRRTPDYMLSCAQDFRRGRMGYQQHPWTATLGGDAVVFTTSPGTGDYTARPNYWAGNLCLPRAVAHENVLLCIYRIQPDFVDHLCSHAYFPQHAFDEIVEVDGWVFGRKGNGYIAMTSLNPGRWGKVDPAMFQAVYGDAWEAHYRAAKPYDYMVQGHANVWAFELGSAAEHGSFAAFQQRYRDAHIEGDSLRFIYRSPSCGEMAFGWSEPLMVDGAQVPIHDYPRYDNPYCQAAFGDTRLEIAADGHRAVLDHGALLRVDA